MDSLLCFFQSIRLSMPRMMGVDIKDTQIEKLQNRSNPFSISRPSVARICEILLTIWVIWPIKIISLIFEPSQSVGGVKTDP